MARRAARSERTRGKRSRSGCGTGSREPSSGWDHLSARFDVTNVFDKVYELRDGSGVGVFAPQFGQRRGFYGRLKYSF